MKRILLLLSFTLFSTIIYCQDVIICIDGKHINCSVTRVDSVNVHFVTRTEGYDVNRYISKEKVKSLNYGGDQSLSDNPGTLKRTVEINSLSEEEMAINRIKSVMEENYFYFTGGLAVSTFLGQDAKYLKERLYKTPRFSFNIGAGFITPLSKRVSIQAGLNYTQKGAVYQKEESSSGSHSSPSGYYVYDYQYNKVVYRLNYAELPVTVRYTPLIWQSSDDICGYFRFGLVPALIIKSDYVYQDNSIASVWDSAESSKRDFNGTRTLDLGGLVGFGIRRWDHFGFEISYETGLRSVIDDEYSGLDFLNSTLMFDFLFYL